MHSRMNRLALAGFGLSILGMVLTIFSALCVFPLILNSTVGAIVGILALVASSIGLTMTAIARSEIVQNAQYGDEYAVSGMVVGIVSCVLSVAALVLYFLSAKNAAISASFLLVRGGSCFPRPWHL